MIPLGSKANSDEAGIASCWAAACGILEVGTRRLSVTSQTATATAKGLCLIKPFSYNKTLLHIHLMNCILSPEDASLNKMSLL